MLQTNPAGSPSQALLRNLINSLVDPVLVKDRNYRWILWNQAFCDLTGYTQEELQGKSDRDIWIGESANLIRNHDQQVFSTELPHTHTHSLRTATGEVCSIPIQRSLFRDESGQSLLLCVLKPPAPNAQVALQTVGWQTSKRFLQLAIDSIPEQIFWKDTRSVYLGCNQSFARAVGVESPAAIVGKRDQDLPNWGENIASEMDSDRRVLETGVPEYNCIIPEQQTDGEHWIEVSKIPLLDESGRVVGMVGTRHDITEQRRVEESLRQSVATSRALVEAIPDLLIRVREDGTYLSRAFEGDFKPQAIDVAVGKNVVDFLPPPVAQKLLHSIQQALCTGELQIHDQEMVIDGQLIYEEVRTIPVGNNTALMMIRNVTDRKRAEIALKELNEELEQKVEERTIILRQAITRLEQEIHDRKEAKNLLQEKEQFLRSIYEGIEHQIFVNDVLPDGQFPYVGWNRFTEQLLEISSEAGRGKSPADIFGVEQGNWIVQNYRRCVEAGTTVSFEECLTFAGQQKWSITTLNPLKNGAGEIHRIVGTAFDITARKQAETALQQSETRLRQQTEALEQTLRELQQTQMQLVQSEKMSSLGQLVAGVAHEINNPVNFIYGNLKHAESYMQDLLGLLRLYQECYPQPSDVIQQEARAIDLDFLLEDLPKLLNSMRVGADRIQAIVTSLRIFSRMDEAEMKEVDLSACIDSTLMILQNRLKAKPDRGKIEVIKSYAAIPPVECYAGQLNQVFMNIISNAIDALEETGVDNPELEPQINISLEMPTATEVIIRLTDNGAGIPDEAKARIFDPFFTTKPIGKGTGMGLSISYQIVTEKHRGQLECNSAPGAGTEFVIRIPVRQS
jgi:PAS domain S-box-containing protein